LPGNEYKANIAAGYYNLVFEVEAKYVVDLSHDGDLRGFGFSSIVNFSNLELYILKIFRI
jgi:hypothetical protein